MMAPPSIGIDAYFGFLAGTEDARASYRLQTYVDMRATHSNIHLLSAVRHVFRVSKFVNKGLIIGGDPNTKEESTCVEADKVHTLSTRRSAMPIAFLPSASLLPSRTMAAEQPTPA